MFRAQRALIFLVVLVLSQMSLAVQLPNPPKSDPALIGWQPLLATAAPNLEALSLKVINEHRIFFTLNDGTKISALFFKSKNSGKTQAPLMLANFGLFSNVYGRSISFFVKSFILTGKLNADVLIVDSVTSGVFYSLNQEIGLGGYDEGRVLIELADQLATDKIRPVYLFGVSLGGNAVIQALLEDLRTAGHRFQGAITFSAVLDEQRSSQSFLGSFGYNLPGPMGPSLSASGKLITDLLLKSTLDFLVREEPDLIPIKKAPGIFYEKSFVKRLGRLNKNQEIDKWNAQVSTTSPATYIQTSSDLLKGVDTLTVPLIVIHAKNDPAVPYSQFKIFAAQQKSNSRIFTHGTRFGGHWGFFDTYGEDWIYELITRLEDYASN